MAAAGRGDHQRYQHIDNPSYNSYASNDDTPPTPVSPLLPSQQLPQLQTDLRNARHDIGAQLVSPMMSRSPSIASDSHFSALSGATSTVPINPTNVQPAPAYVAPFGAVQVVTEDASKSRRDGPDDEDSRPSKDDISFTPAALSLVNAFLDQLLYSILSGAKSTNLGALRPAVTEILKNKLARDAIASADDELRDLLSGNDEEDEKSGKDDNKWDLELVWKRTRLRVMVYMRLGEMEDEDEERYVKEQGLRINGEHSRFSSTAGLVSWSAAIFLTSVLEHVAEQTLQVAGNAAISRARRKARAEDSTSSTVVVEEQDAERIAVNPVLGRLWRSWRKTVRTTARPVTPSQPREIASIISPPKSQSSPRDSFGTAPESAHEDEAARLDRLADNPPDPHYPEHILASNIRLPMGDALRDVDEIEVPGLARDPSEVGSDDGLALSVPTERRRSFSNYLSRSSEVEALTPPPIEESTIETPKLKRRRSSSVPTMVRRSVMFPSKPDVTSAPIGEATPKQAENVAPANIEFDPFLEDTKRKSLIDIKTLLAAIDGGFAQYSSKPKLETVIDRPGSSDSAADFQDAAAESTQPDPSSIGVATTSDTAVAPERVPSAPGTRSTPSPIPHSGRAPSIPRSKYSPNPPDDSTAPAAGDVSQRDRPIEPNEKTLAALQDAVQRASSPQAVQTPPAEPVTKRQSSTEQYGAVSAYSNQTSYWDNRTPNKVTTPGAKSLTSSSIRGPEDFDEFVQSGEVVKYTLTPDNIRTAPSSDAQALAQLTGEVPPVITLPVNKEETDGRSGRSLTSKSLTGSTTDKKAHRFSVTRPPSRNTSAHRKSGLMARDARVVTESTRDFADFIRSTKPDKEPEIRPFVVTNQSATSLQTLRNSTNYSLPRTSSFTGDRSRSLTKTDIDAGHAPPVPILPSSGKPRMQAKSAKGDDPTGSSELINFIRDGPKQDGAHRISRTVAPFRNTMDSEQFNEFKTSHPVRPEDRGVSNYSQSTQPSTRASMSSKTPLINGANNVVQPAYSGKVQSLNALSANPTGAPAPERKRYRNKDPYAIDSDDDEEDVSALPRGTRAGESLAEFLRSAEPPKEGDAKPIASASSIAQARELRERARANNVNGNRRDSYYSSGQSTETALPAPPRSSGNTMQPRPPTAGRAGDRLGVGSGSNTKELADFLRSSGPAPAPAVSRGNQSQQPEAKEKKRGFFSFLRRPSTKGKSPRHADMP